MTPQETEAKRTPGIVRFAVWLTFINTWVLFEETVVDRYGLWQYMPYYRVAKFCLWSGPWPSSVFSSGGSFHAGEAPNRTGRLRFSRRPSFGRSAASGVQQHLAQQQSALTL